MAKALGSVLSQDSMMIVSPKPFKGGSQVWYPAQELYKALGIKLSVTSQDYAGTTEKVLKEEGYDE